MLKTLRTFNYHPKLILTILKTSIIGGMTINILSPLFYCLLFIDFIPQSIILIWISSMFIIFTFRIIIYYKFKVILKKNNKKSINILLKFYLFFIFLGAFLWGLSSIPVLLYANESYVFIFIALIFGMLTGSMATLNSIYHASFLFITSMILPLIFALVFIGSSITYYYAALLLSVYMPIALSTSFRMFLSLNRVIIQNEKIKVLNKLLEQKIKVAVEDSKKKEEMLQQQSKLAQMGEMISMIAHQWRQPLGAISSAVMGIKIKIESEVYDIKKQDDRDKLFKFIDKKHNNISEYVQVLSTTIDDFRNFFKPDKNKEVINLTIPIERALQIVEISMNSKGIEISTDYNINEKIFMYQNEMMQVILNILKNSEDNFLEKKIKKPKIDIVTKKDNNDCIIMISDNGGGIPTNIIQKIFNPYFSTKNEKNGTGLGLYMSKIMVEEHNKGSLSVENIDNGICFKIVLKGITDV